MPLKGLHLTAKHMNAVSSGVAASLQAKQKSDTVPAVKSYHLQAKHMTLYSARPSYSARIWKAALSHKTP